MNKKLVLLGVIIGVLAAGLALAGVGHFGAERPPWCFKGAYVGYIGRVSSSLASISVIARYRVVDVQWPNVTVKGSLEYSGLALFVPLANKTEGVVTCNVLKEPAVLIFYSKEWIDAQGLNETLVRTAFLGPRSCYLLEKRERDGVARIYIDKELLVPVVMELIYERGRYPITLRLELVETNIKK